MSNTFHTNISSNSTSKMELYKIWDEDLKNKIKKDWRTECPQFIRSVSKSRKSKTVKKK